MDDQWQSPSNNSIVLIIVIVLLIIGAIILIIAIYNSGSSNSSNNQQLNNTSDDDNDNDDFDPGNGREHNVSDPVSTKNSNVKGASKPLLPEKVASDKGDAAKADVVKDEANKLQEDKVEPVLPEPLEATQSSGDVVSIEALARQQDLASVEDVFVFDTNGNEVNPRGLWEPSSNSGEAYAIAETMVKSAESVEISVLESPTGHEEAGGVSRPLLPQPPKISPFVPAITGSKKVEHHSGDETFGITGNATMTNPGDMSSDFSSLTEKPTTTTKRKRRDNTDSLNQLREIGKSKGNKR
jgi:hypothetical protein